MTRNCRFWFFCLAITVAVAVHAATITVSSTADSGAGTLRNALAAANDGDTIDATGVSGSIYLTSGQLSISKSLTVLGPGAYNLSIVGNLSNRVFHVYNGAVATITGLWIRNGGPYGTNDYSGGGGFRNDDSTLTVSNCVISGNSGGSTIGTHGAGTGGGILNFSFSSAPATLTIVSSALVGNYAYLGGGIMNWARLGFNSKVKLISSTLSGNYATSRLGGAIYSAADSGRTASVTIVATTLSDNYSGVNSTAIYLGVGATPLEIGNSILNNPGTNVFAGTSEITSHGYNIISDSGGGFFTATGDKINTNPMLGPLSDNGGPTFTHALMVGSPAIDAGKRDVIPELASSIDQRGEPRYDNPDISNASGGDGTDIGAYEASELRVTAVQMTGADFQLSFTSWLGTNYEVQSRSDLTTGSWLPLAGSTPGNGGVASTTVSNAFSVPKQFYRIHPVP